MIPFLSATPQLFIYEQNLIEEDPTKYQCTSTGYTSEWQRQLYFTIFACYVLFIPVICMTYWYIRIIQAIGSSIKFWSKNLQTNSRKRSSAKIASPTKVRTIKLAMMIIFVFVACWTPYMVVNLIEIYSHGRFHLPVWFDGILQTLCLLQSGLNPIIYMSFNGIRRYSPVLVLAAASTVSLKSERVGGRYRRKRGGSISFNTSHEDMYRRSRISSVLF